MAQRGRPRREEAETPKPTPSGLVQMQRNGVVVDVHPNEVDNYRRGGYVRIS